MNFTPLLHFREPGLLFGDVTKTLSLFKSSKNLLEQVLFRAEDLGMTEISLALSDTAAGAQALTRHFDFFISEPGRESFSLAPLPTSSLRDLEGLQPWENPSQVEEICDFLAGLGLPSLGDLMKLPSESWSLRWGDLGLKFQSHLGSKQKEVFSPLCPDQPLVAYHHYDFPISDLDWLLASIEPRLNELLLRLEGREQSLDALQLLLICEYSNEKHSCKISPSHKSRDLQLMMTLLRERLQKVNLQNPIREWELEIKPIASQPQQLDFWEPQSQEKENLLRLQSLLHDRRIESGFLKPHPSLLPEQSWRFQNEPEDFVPPKTDFIFEGSSHKEIPVYSEGLNLAPRPTQLVHPPQKLNPEALSNFRFLHRVPLERFNLPWQKTARDYWVAVNENKQCVWVFRDLHTSQYYLHGYFD